jgi:vacuolar-type H+-ATPase subunit H
MFVTAYYVVYNAQWLLLNTADDKNVSSVDNNSKMNVNGVPIVYKPYKKLVFFSWLGWLAWCIIIGWIIAIAIFPLSMGITAYTLLKWLFFIIFLPSTCNDEPCNVFTMFVDTFKYKKPLISWIMSLMVISASFDVFDTTGGTIAIIVLLLVYFNFIKIGLFDNYVPTEADAFVPMEKGIDLVPPPCVTKYADFDTTVDTTYTTVDTTDTAVDTTDTAVDNKDLTEANADVEADVEANADATDTIDKAKEAVTTAATDTINKAKEAATDVFNKAKDTATEAATDVFNKAKKTAKDAFNKSKDTAITAAKNSMVEMVSPSSPKNK